MHERVPLLSKSIYVTTLLVYVCPFAHKGHEKKPGKELLCEHLLRACARESVCLRALELNFILGNEIRRR